MTQEDKELVLKDLCARLPYNLYIRVEEFNVPENDGRITEGLIGNYLKGSSCNDYDVEGLLNEYADGLIDVKPYLRPMSSMTKEERDELERLSEEYFGKAMDKQIQESLSSTNRNESEILEYIASSVIVDRLNAHHFDYRGLIPMGLALEATEGMYKTWNHLRGNLKEDNQVIL